MSVFRTLTSALVALSLMVSGFANAGVDPVQPDHNTGANFNRYAYANNNPYRYVDPDGRQSRDFNEISREKGTYLKTPPSSPQDWLGPAIGASLAVMAAPAVAYGGAELGLAALANPATVNSIGIGAAEVVAGTQIASRVPSPEAMIGSLAQSHANSGVPGLMPFLRGGEQAAVASGSRATPAMLGQAVHRATAQSLNQMAPGRFQYNSRAPWDFTDTATGQALELTTPGQAASHANRGADLVFYTLPQHP